MKNSIFCKMLLLITGFILFGLTSQSFALLVSGPDIIDAPTSVIDDYQRATNIHQQAFDEMQNVLLENDLEVDSGTIPAGTYVSSHMIFFNLPEGEERTESNATWTFDGMVLGVMSDYYGELEAASNTILGSTNTEYPELFKSRGMKGSDWYKISNNKIEVYMIASQPGDWIRVITDRRSDSDGRACYSSVKLKFKTDKDGDDTSWELKDKKGKNLYDGRNYGAKQVYKESFELSPGNYVFTIYDDFKDGLKPGEGSYELIDGNNKKIRSGGYFDVSESTSFCIK